jgi:PAS domain S-box-containing protein
MSGRQKNMRQSPGESITPDHGGAGTQELETRCIRGQEAIERSEGSYLALARNLPGIVYRLFPGEKSRMVFLNDAVREMTGFAPEELLHGKVCSIDPLIIPEDRSQITETVKQAIINKQPFEIEYRLTHRDGTIRYFLERGNPVSSEQGDISYIDGVIFDISSRKQVEEVLRQSRKELELQVEERIRELGALNVELKKSQDLLKKMFDSLNDAVLLVNPNTRRIIAANPATERVLGHREQELIGRSTKMLHVNKAMFEKFGIDSRAALDAKGVYQCEFQMRRKDGNIVYTEHTVSELLDDSGKRTGVVSFIRDISERKEVEKELLAYQDRLRSLSSELSLTEERERRKFAEDLHDSVAQLLVLAKFHLEEMQAKSPSTSWETELEEVCQYLDEALKRTRLMMYELSPPNLYALGLKAGLRGLAERMGRTHNLQVDFSADEIREGTLKEDTSVLLYRSVQELLMNLVKHAEVSRAKLSLFKKDDAIHVEVKDEGIGCDLPNLTKYSEVEKGGGFGLLSIKERLRHLGGRFDISSQPGKGTLVTLTVPLPKETVVTIAEHVAPITVLIADDHQMMREGLRSLLERQNFEIVGEARDGEEAMRIARETTPDVVIMDIEMPVMDGVEATRQINAELPEIKIIGLSMNHDKFRISQALESGASGFVLKGSAFQVLKRAIHAVVNDKSIFLSADIKDFFPDSDEKPSSNEC